MLLHVLAYGIPGGLVQLRDANPTAEAIAKLIFDHATQLGFPVTSVRLWEAEHSVAAYRQL